MTISTSHHTIHSDSIISAIAIIVLTVLYTANINAASFSGGYAYFYNKGGWSDSYKQLCIGKSSYTETRNMTAIANTKLWYNALPTSGWGDATYMAVMGNSSSWGSGSWGTSNLKNANHRTGSFNISSWNFNDKNVNMITPASGSNDASISIDYLGNAYSVLNKTITFRAKVSTDGGSSYSDAGTPAKLTASSYKFSSYTSCSSSSSATLSASGSSTTVSCGYTATTKLTAADATGYEFIGWYNSSGTCETTSKTLTIYPTAAATYYAYYVQTYEVRVTTITPSSGGSATPTSWTYMSPISGSAITATPNTGYTFTGWTILSGGGGYFGASGTATTSSTANTVFRPTKSTSLKATFTPKTYIVTLDGNGGSDGSATATYNSNTLTGITHASRTGYSLNGYFTASSGGTKVVNADGSLVSSTVSGYLTSGYWTKDAAATLFAQWTEDLTYYTVRFTYGTSSTGNVTVSAKNTSTSASIEYNESVLSGTSITLTATPDAAYKFEGWYTNAACTTAAGGDNTANPYTFTLTGNTILYAKVILKTTSITLNKNGGSGGTAGPLTATYGNSSYTPALTNPARSGHTFTGYWDASSGGNKVIGTDGTFVASTDYANSSKKWQYDGESLTLYAQWNETLSTITINASPAGSGTFTVDGSAFAEGSTTTAGTGTSRTVVATPRAGYRYSSWSKSGNAAGSYSTNTYTLSGNGSGGTGTLTANFTRTYAFIQGRFHVTNAARNGTWTNTFTSGDWNESSTRIPFDYDNTNHRFYLHTYTTPKELTNTISGYNPYFYVKTSTSSGSLSNVVSYWSATSTTMTTAGTGSKKTLTHTGTLNNANLRFNSSDESGYVILYFDEAGVWYELEQTLQYNGNGNTSGSAPAEPAYYVKGTNATAASNTYVRSGYVFTGWNTKADGSGISYAAGANVPMTANITLYAQWAEATFEVTVNNGAHGTVSPNGVQNIGSSGLVVTATPNTGYTFKNWTTTGAGVTVSSATSATTTISASSNGTVSANYVDTLVTLTVASGSANGATLVNGLVVGNTSTLNVSVTSNVTGTFTVTFYNEAGVSIGSQTTTSHSFTYTTPALNTYAATTIIKAKVTAGNVTSSKFSQTKIYMKAPTITSIRTTPITLGTSESLRAEYTNVKSSIARIEIAVTGSGTAAGMTYNQAFDNPIGIKTYTFKPQKAGTYNYTVSLKANGTVVATTTNSFVVSLPSITLNATSDELLVDDDNTESTTLTATFTGVDASVSGTATYTFKEGSTTLAAPQATNTYTYTPTTVGTKDMTVVLNITVDGVTGQYTSSVKKIYTKYYIHIADNCNWGNIHAHHWISGGSSTTWPGDNLEKVPDSNNKWYVFLMNTKYTGFIFNNGQSTDSKIEKTGDLTPNASTYPDKSHFRFEFNSGTGPKIYTLSRVTAPTLTLSYNYFGNTYITMTGRITNFGNYGLTANELTECGFTVKDNVTNVTTDYTACNVHSTDEYFEHTLTDLVPGRSYTITAWARHCELKGTSAPITKTTTTGTTLVKVKNEMGWYSMYLYAYYKDNKCGGWMTKTYEMTYLGNSWYYTYVDNDYNYFQLHDGSVWANNETAVEATCYTNKASGTNNRIGKISCASLNLYQVEIQENGNTYHSNVVDNIADTLSFYASAASTVTLLRFSGSDVTRTNISSTFSSYTEGDVFIARVATTAGTSLTGLARYTGSFYVRTDGKTDTWDDYKNAEKTMIRFENKIDLYPNEYYNHYWCQYLPPSTNIKAQLANDYNKHISTTLPNDPFLPYDTLPKQSDSEINWGTNVRFAYNNTNNLFEVKLLQAANIETFLQVYGYANGGDNSRNYAFKESDCTSKMTSGNKLNMSDLSDWMYQVDFYICAEGDNANVDIIANYKKDGVHNDVIHLGGEDAEKQVVPFLVMGDQTSDGTYLLRVIYDYKTNRVVAAWLPYGADLPNGILDANMMIIRIDDNDAKTVGVPSENRELTDIHKIYAILEINQSEYLARKASGNKFYWISLPFDVKVKDIFGIDGFKTKWAIQRYRGDLRAQNGYNEGNTFWRNMNANETATMEAGRGYVVWLNLESSDFNNVTYLDENGDKQVRSLKRLFFPSDNTTDFTLTFDGSNLSTTLPKNECEITDRRNEDSNWYVAGIKGYNTSHIHSPTAVSDDTIPALTSPYYFYQWDWVADGNHQSDNYTARTVSGYDFKPFQSYMFQYAGTISWEPTDIKTSKPAPAKQGILAKRGINETILTINLEDDNQLLDQTFITLTDRTNISEDFDLNSDLTKIINLHSQIYSLAGKTKVAGNVTPSTTERIPLGVKIDETADYIFHLEDLPSNQMVYLYDSKDGTRTCLNYNDHNVILDAGNYDQRFFIKLAQMPSVATDIDIETSTLNVSQFNGYLYIEGVENDSRLDLFDVTGKQIISTHYNSGQGIPAPQSGIYLLNVNNQTFKIIVK